MAEGKKSFVLYSDLIHTVRKMPKEKAGELLMIILAYVNDENPVVDDVLVDVVFEPIKLQMKRDLVKYEESKERFSKAGLASAEAKRLAKENQQRSTTFNNVQQEPTNSTVTVTVNDTVTVNVTENVIKEKEKAASGSEVSEKSDLVVDAKKEKKEKPPIAPPPQEIIIPPEINNSFLAWLEMRKKQRKPPTGYAISLAIEKLQKLAPNDFNTQNEIINKSIVNNWTDFYQLKQNGTNQNTGNSKIVTPGKPFGKL